MSEQKFAAFDIDGTLFRSGLYREIFYELTRMNVLPEHLLQELADKESAWKKRAHGSAFGEFEQAMAEMFDQHLTQIKVAYFDLAAERVIENHKDNVYVYTRDLAKQLKKEGRTLIAISGSQTELVEPFAKHYGFDIWIGGHYVREGDSFTGEVIKTHKGKGKFLKQLVEENDLTFEGSVAVGDTKGDVEMLEMVEHPIAFNPEQRLFEHAHRAGWEIVIERKNMIYMLKQKGGAYHLHNTITH